MTRSELNRRYFDWMYGLVCGGKYPKKMSYRKLFHRLHEIDFTFTIPMDDNRASDGIDLRYRYGYENDLDGPMIASYLDDRPCSVLEMLIALAIRCEEHIMGDPEIGDRTGQWFWNMIVNLGLGSMTDARYDEEFVDELVLIFLDREYSANGEGGLFTVQHPKYDMRTVEIWYQMNWYLNEFASKRRY